MAYPRKEAESMLKNVPITVRATEIKAALNIPGNLKTCK
jgi:hypothetical protein